MGIKQFFITLAVMLQAEGQKSGDDAAPNYTLEMLNNQDGDKYSLYYSTEDASIEVFKQMVDNSGECIFQIALNPYIDQEWEDEDDEDYDNPYSYHVLLDINFTTNLDEEETFAQDKKDIKKFYNKMADFVANNQLLSNMFDKYSQIVDAKLKTLD